MTDECVPMPSDLNEPFTYEQLAALFVHPEGWRIAANQLLANHLLSAGKEQDDYDQERMDSEAVVTTG
jgi:hypothetical protein